MEDANGHQIAVASDRRSLDSDAFTPRHKSFTCASAGMYGLWTPTHRRGSCSIHHARTVGLEATGIPDRHSHQHDHNTKTAFWLHIKKSAGVTTRNLLKPYHAEVDRNKEPKVFAHARPDEHNEIPNNYRVALGDHQFKRFLFAKKFLYSERWEQLCSFAFSREPIDR